MCGRGNNKKSSVLTATTLSPGHDMKVNNKTSPVAKLVSTYNNLTTLSMSTLSNNLSTNHHHLTLQQANTSSQKWKLFSFFRGIK